MSEIANPFVGQLMKCVVCGVQQFSHAKVETQWRGIEVNGKLFYACPKEFPGDGATAEQYRVAYLLVLKQIALKGPA